VILPITAHEKTIVRTKVRSRPRISTGRLSEPRSRERSAESTAMQHQISGTTRNQSPWAATNRGTVSDEGSNAPIFPQVRSHTLTKARVSREPPAMMKSWRRQNVVTGWKSGFTLLQGRARRTLPLPGLARQEGRRRAQMTRRARGFILRGLPAIDHGVNARLQNWNCLARLQTDARATLPRGWSNR
jgi:hypothetical protein